VGKPAKSNSSAGQQVNPAGGKNDESMDQSMAAADI